jgi:hypothetical protein
MWRPRRSSNNSNNSNNSTNNSNNNSNNNHLCEAGLGLEDEVGDAKDGVSQAREPAARGGAVGAAGLGLVHGQEDDEPVLALRLL